MVVVKEKDGIVPILKVVILRSFLEEFRVVMVVLVLQNTLANKLGGSHWKRAGWGAPPIGGDVGASMMARYSNEEVTCKLQSPRETATTPGCLLHIEKILVELSYEKINGDFLVLPSAYRDRSQDRKIT
ncbi:hypothetical protein DMENIID0001_018980 [Sergentomyia squamirostris]